MSFGLSVIIPAYNAAPWLEPTVARINDALNEAKLKKAEIIIVNDGSTDDTSAVANALVSDFSIRTLDQTNQGRFLARKTGVINAQYDNLLFIDSRVFLHKGSLAFILREQLSDPVKKVWNGHVYVAKKGNIIARFGDAITFIGWRRYFSNPRTTSYGLEDFDHYPKGTGCFFAPKSILLSAIKEFESQALDLRNSSDDTHLIRIIARENRINVSPGFACTYHARTHLAQFIKHTYFRGQFFVDGFLRPGNRFFVPLIGFLLLTAVVPLIIMLHSEFLVLTILFSLVLWILGFIVALALGVGMKDSISLLALSPIFTIVYGFGIWVAVLRRAIKKLG